MLKLNKMIYIDKGRNHIDPDQSGSFLIRSKTEDEPYLRWRDAFGSFEAKTPQIFFKTQNFQKIIF